MTIKEIREHTGLSQSAFARATGVPVRTLQQWEQGRSKPPAYVESLIERVMEQGSIATQRQSDRNPAETANRAQCAVTADSMPNQSPDFTPSQSPGSRHEAALARLANGEYTIPTRNTWKTCTQEPFQNCNRIHALQQRKVAHLLGALRQRDGIRRAIVFGSSTTERCHTGSDVDLYVELDPGAHDVTGLCEGLDFECDLWTNRTADTRLISEIEKTGVVVYG